MFVFFILNNTILLLKLKKIWSSSTLVLKLNRCLSLSYLLSTISTTILTYSLSLFKKREADEKRTFGLSVSYDRVESYSLKNGSRVVEIEDQ